MKKCLSLWSVHRLFEQNKISLGEFVSFASDIGAEGVEIVSFLLTDKERQLKELKDALERYHLTLAAYSINSDFAKSTESERRSMIDDVKEEIDTATALGCQVVRIFSSDFGNGNPYATARSHIVEGLKEVCAYAGTKNVYLALENHGYFAGTCRQMEDILRDVDSRWLFVTLDIGNFILMDDDPAYGAMRLAPKAALVHVKDFHRVSESYPLKTYTSNAGLRYIGAVITTGVIDVKYALEQLYRNDYKGYLTLEYDGGEPDTRENLRTGMDILGRLLNKIREEDGIG